MFERFGAFSKEFDACKGFLQEASVKEVSDGDFLCWVDPAIEDGVEHLVEVHVIKLVMGLSLGTPFRESSVERCLSSLETRVHTSSSTGFLPLMASSALVAFAGTSTTTDDLGLVA